MDTSTVRDSRTDQVRCIRVEGSRIKQMLFPSGNPFKCHEEVLYLQPMIWSHLNVLTVFPPDWGMLRRSRRVLIFHLTQTTALTTTTARPSTL